MRIQFNDDNSNRGIEGWYEIKNDKLVIFLTATNSREDWLSNFTAFPLYSNYSGCCVHAGYTDYAVWVADLILDIAITNEIDAENIILFGYSMGGGIAQIVGADMTDINIVSIDGPRTTSKVNDNMRLIYNYGSLVHNVPIWFKKIKKRIVLNEAWKPFWKAHADYDIDAIIAEYNIEQEALCG